MALLEKLIEPVHDSLEVRMKEKPFCTFGGSYDERSKKKSVMPWL